MLFYFLKVLNIISQITPVEGNFSVQCFGMLTQILIANPGTTFLKAWGIEFVFQKVHIQGYLLLDYALARSKQNDRIFRKWKKRTFYFVK